MIKINVIFFRLSQAHARLMFHGEVEIMDAIFAVTLVESSMQGESAILSLNVNNVQSSFPTDPQKEYSRLCEKIFTNLGFGECQ